MFLAGVILARKSERKSDSICWTELPAFALPWSAKRTGLYQSGDNKNKGNKVCEGFSIFLLVPEKIYFKVGQWKIFGLLSRAGTWQEKYLEFHEFISVLQKKCKIDHIECFI